MKLGGALSISDKLYEMSSLQELRAILYDVEALQSASGLMSWDQQVLMPPKGAGARGAQTAILSRMAHQKLTSDETLRALEKAEAGAADEEERATVRVVKRQIGTATKLPSELVRRKSEVSNIAYQTWRTAKPISDFEALRPHLEELFEIARETAAYIGYESEPYDALIDLYEEGATTADATAMFEAIKAPIINLVKEIQSDGLPIDDSLLVRDWDQPKLLEVCRKIITQIGFDFDRGRLDMANNAFCGGSSTSDIRMTSRPSEHIKGLLSSSLHEMGHALYEQNSPMRFDRTPLKGGISLGVHESQSRTWENVIGRSLPFWKFFFPQVAETFPFLAPLGAEGFYRGLSKVEPSFIRVGADELTYNLHILVRFELEVELVNRRLEVKDLPEAWNQRYRDYLGINPPNHALGCMQDVHWTRGSSGYFPTYSMGNLIGAQIWKTLTTDLGNTDDLMARGDFAPILGWLVEKVYSKAKLYRPRDLVTRVTGRPMEAGDWLQYAEMKYRSLYGLGG